MTKIHHPDPTHRKRAAERVDIEFEAFVGVERHRKVPILVGDLSSDGFRCCCARRLPIGERVVLKVPGLGDFPATIAWQLGPQAGAKFVAPLPRATIMRIMLKAMAAQDAPIEPKRAAAR